MITDLFPHKLLIYADVEFGDRFNPEPKKAKVIIADTVCNYQYTDAFALTSDLFGSNNVYINTPYTLVPEGDLHNIDIVTFPQFANVTTSDGDVIDITNPNTTIEILIEFETVGGAKWSSSIIKSESVKVGKIQGYEVGTTFWVELGR